MYLQGDEGHLLGGFMKMLKEDTMLQALRASSLKKFLRIEYES